MYIPAVGNVGGVDGGREEEEGQDALPGLNDTVGDGSQDHVEPDVGEHGPGGGDGEHPQVLDLPHLVVGDDVHAEADDHEQVEGGGSDNGAGSKIAGPEALGPDLNHGQHDLGSGRTQGHEGQVGDGLVPDLDNDDLGLAGLGVLDGDLLLLGGDHLDGLHEPVGHDGDADEEVHHEQNVEETAAKTVAAAQVVEGFPNGDDQTVGAVDALGDARGLQRRTSLDKLGQAWTSLLTSTAPSSSSPSSSWARVTVEKTDKRRHPASRAPLMLLGNILVVGLPEKRKQKCKQGKLSIFDSSLFCYIIT